LEQEGEMQMAEHRHCATASRVQQALQLQKKQVYKMIKQTNTCYPLLEKKSDIKAME
jgi:hypothetical protein